MRWKHRGAYDDFTRGLAGCSAGLMAALVRWPNPFGQRLANRVLALLMRAIALMRLQRRPDTAASVGQPARTGLVAADDLVVLRAYRLPGGKNRPNSGSIFPGRTHAGRQWA